MPTQLPILNQPRAEENQPRHAHESFAAARDLEAQLRATLRGEVRFSPADRALYATDASNYRAAPIGVVIPRDAADVEATLAACRSLGAAVLPRGAGTSLSGQCCNVAVVLDFSKYMRRLVSLDPEKKVAVVEPGIVLDRVREAAEQHHLTFAPDPATHSRCTIGGMIGNNSCGTHSVMGGLTANNIHSLDILLYDGTRMTVGAATDDEISAIVARGGRPAAIYAGLRHIRDRYCDEIRRRFPRIPRRVSGYNLDELLPERGFHVARALVGSEGTLATVLSATLHLMPSPQCRRLAVLGFPDPFLAADAVPAIIRHGPIGLEGIDAMLLDFMRRKNLAVDDMTLLPPGGGFLLAEFGADSDAEAEAKARDLLADASAFPGSPSGRLCTPAEAARLWHIRESALGATVFVPGEPHGWEGWEDAGVPPERLGSYLRQLWALMKDYGYRSPMYGHFGQGCVHTRINFDLESEPGIRKFRAFIDQAADIVIAHGGSISGEHGDGRARAALLPKMFGPDLIEAFRAFKSLWDPDNRMNPAILMDPASAPASATETPAPAIYQPEDHLRLGAGYQSPRPATFFHFPDDNGSLGEATLRCVGVGACRKEHAGTMCPSYMATREERHSTRGRAHLLWELLEGKVLGSGRDAPDWHNESVREALDLCLSCKACKSECPVNVDLATYKAEFLAHYYGDRLRPPQHYAFGFMDRIAHLASLIPGLTPRLANLPLATPGLSHAIKAILGVAPQRRLPRFAPRSFQSEWRNRRLANSPFTDRDQTPRDRSAPGQTPLGPSGFVSGHDFSRADQPQQEEGALAPMREAQTVEAPAFRPGNEPSQNERALAPGLKGHAFENPALDEPSVVKGHDLGNSLPAEPSVVKGHDLGNSLPAEPSVVKGHAFENPALDEPSLVKGHGFSRADQPRQEDGALAPVREAQTVEAPAFRPGNEPSQNERALAPGLKGHAFENPALDEPSVVKGHDFSRADNRLKDEGALTPGRVLLWPDTWNNYYHPPSLHAAAQVLTSAGFAPEVPRHHVCCGRPLYDFGFLPAARAYLLRILEQFAPHIDAGLPFIFLEPSCASVFRDELVNFFPPGSEFGPRAQRLRSQTFLLSEFLVRHAPGYIPAQLPGREILLHGHCHHQSMMKMTDEVDLLRRTGATVTLLDSGCCGMAGPFGFERDKYEVSQAIGERVLLPAVRAASPDTLLVADGFSCREQVSQNTTRCALHFAEVLAGITDEREN